MVRAYRTSWLKGGFSLERPKLDGTGDRRFILPSSGNRRHPRSDLYIVLTRGNIMNDPNKIQATLNINPPRTLTQQIFHKGMFESRPRSNSISDIPITTSQEISTQTQQDIQNNDTENWQQVQSKKRLRSPDDTRKPSKQTKLGTYWLSQAEPISTTNSFAQLDVDPSQNLAEKVLKSPPIYVDKVENIQPLVNLLNEYALDNYELKVLNNDQVKIQPKTPDAYRDIVKQLEIKNTEFYTYKPKQDRTFKVVLKNMHPSTDIEELKKSMADLGHNCTNIWNIKQRTSKKPLPMFIVEVESNPNNKSIYNIKSLLNCRISFEPPRPKREIPQCAKCQQYGHTKGYCRRSPKCIKCAGDHPSIECPRKTRSDQVKCVLCDGNHPANYKGCQVYRELEKIKLPSKPDPVRRNLSSKHVQVRQQQALQNNNTDNQVLSQDTRYRDALLQQNGKIEAHEDKSSSNDMTQLLIMMKQMMEQLTTMTNLIIALTTRLTNSIPSK